jgi:glycosyltransferase involved in cell wall biosynthesis
MIKELCVIGHPSNCGGADTELYDQIKCWHAMGIKIYILHTGPIYGQAKKLQPILEKKYGCTYMKPRHWNHARGFHCISFCNGQFLQFLPQIKRYAKSTTFVNCMTWNFKNEIKRQREGLIDFHLYQTDHGLNMVSKALKQFDDYHPLRVDPYFDPEPFPYYGNRPNDHFRFGRISRADIVKFSHNQIDIYDGFKSPVEKSGLIMGWSPMIMKKVTINARKIKTENVGGKNVMFYDDYIQLLKEGTVSQQDFYKFCDVLILAADTLENLPRVGFECMASGTVMVVDNRGGWTLQVEDGATGYLCEGPREFIEKSSFIAKNPQLKEDLRGLARNKLEQEWGIERAMKSWDRVFSEWKKKS